MVISRYTYHWAHIVSPSPYPFVVGMSMGGVTLGAIIGWNYLNYVLLIVSVFTVILGSLSWWISVGKENFEGVHVQPVINGFRIGMVLFLISEAFFFFSFFWSFFHVCWCPSGEIGEVWPPFSFYNIMVDPFGIPLLNTMILLSSGATVTYCHHEVSQNKYSQSFNSLFITVILGGLFIFFQLFEYANSDLSFNSGFYGSIFFLMTGFHGAHVCIGTIFLVVCWLRLSNRSLSTRRLVSFEFALWYWHFVDVIWIFLFIVVYYYGFVL
uniref:Cytochrome c oxidase subunit 3 n=1 Tax=Syndesmis kurakaikina TaxID=2711315 RepID=A0A7G5XUK2_9PLAT|nr:cytochrome c oxidase subunit 3 [Syndesmis kurakaikina]